MKTINSICIAKPKCGLLEDALKRSHQRQKVAVTKNSFKRKDKIKTKVLL